MNFMPLALRPADLADLAACRGLVDACGLPVDRAGAPESLRRSAEFAELCPASATCMRLRLAR